MRQDNMGPASDSLRKLVEDKRDVLFISILDENGTVIFTDPPVETLRKKYDIKDVEETHTTPEAPLKIMDAISRGAHYQQHERLLFNTEGEYGFLKIGYSTNAFLAEKTRMTWQLGTAVFLFVLFSVGLVIWFSFRITRPILYLALIARKIGEGKLDEKVIVKTGGDELEALGDAMNDMVKGLKERDLVKDTFARYVTIQVAEELLNNPESLALGGKKQYVTVLFSDIRGFTSFSENFPPEQVVEHLNEYFSSMVDVVFKNEGTLDKFIGDAIMAVFGAPIQRPDDALRAVRTALEMRERLAALNKRWLQQGKKPFEIGIGLNSGEAIAGNIGDMRRMEYTIIGNNVNLASRLESLTKDIGAPIIISESTYRLVEDSVEARKLKSTLVKGINEPVMIYELIGMKREDQC